MSLNEELQRVGTSKGWHLDLQNSVLELDGIHLPGAILLGTNTLGEFLWADEYHPSAANLSKSTIDKLNNLRSSFADIPEIQSNGILVEDVLEDPVSIGYLIGAICSVALGPTWAYYRAPRSESSWGWIAFDASPLDGAFSKSLGQNTSNHSSTTPSGIDPHALAGEVRKYGIQLALSPIPPFNFHNATRAFCQIRLLGAAIFNNQQSRDSSAMQQYLKSILEEKQMAPAEVDKLLKERSQTIMDNNLSVSTMTTKSHDLIHNASTMSLQTDDAGYDMSAAGRLSVGSPTTAMNLDDLLDIQYVSDIDESDKDQDARNGWIKLLVWEKNSKKNDPDSLLASIVFDSEGRLQSVGVKPSSVAPSPHNPVSSASSSNAQAKPEVSPPSSSPPSSTSIQQQKSPAKPNPPSPVKPVQQNAAPIMEQQEQNIPSVARNLQPPIISQPPPPYNASQHSQQQREEVAQGRPTRGPNLIDNDADDGYCFGLGCVIL